MNQLLTKRDRADMRQSFKLVVLRILAVPPVIVIACAVLLGLLAHITGMPGAEFALDFILKAAGPIAVLQGKMLLGVVFIGALYLFVGWYRIDVLAGYAADKLDSRIKALSLFWKSMLAGVRTLFYLPPALELRVSRWDLIPGARAGFISGHTPKLE